MVRAAGLHDTDVAEVDAVLEADVGLDDRRLPRPG
jgi:hypothetical protein